MLNHVHQIFILLPALQLVYDDNNTRNSSSNTAVLADLQHWGHLDKLNNRSEQGPETKSFTLEVVNKR